MSDFTQTMKDWRRMCGSFFYCHQCPLGRCPSPTKNIWDIGKSFDNMEKAIDKWAKEHPEPQYPTWREWLIRQGLVDFKPYWSPSIPTGNTTIACLSSKALEPIPADIAEKLGIKPKERDND